MKTAKLFNILALLILLPSINVIAAENPLDFATEICADYLIKSLQSGHTLSHSEPYIPIMIEESENRIKTLYKDLEYKFVACGDEGIRDLNITLYDIQGIPLQTSTRLNSLPILYFTPSNTGPYLIKIESTESSGNFSFLIFVN
ncbi:MAG: hypothetical protein GY786_23445 [Proteobacteria bacterium]|nr:hypothetical protein [Pseudomonadota bacterium]